jgi:hypothetical protein
MSSSASTPAAAVSIAPKTSLSLCADELRPLHLSFGCPLIDKLLSPATAVPLQAVGGDGIVVSSKSAVARDGFSHARCASLTPPQGLPLQGLIELVGEASSGKTQFALTAVARVCDLRLLLPSPFLPSRLPTFQYQ